MRYKFTLTMLLFLNTFQPSTAHAESAIDTYMKCFEGIEREFEKDSKEYNVMKNICKQAAQVAEQNNVLDAVQNEPKKTVVIERPIILKSPSKAEPTDRKTVTDCYKTYGDNFSCTSRER